MWTGPSLRCLPSLASRATIVFSGDGNTQRISWEWRPEDGWLPLCDRTAYRIT